MVQRETVIFFVLLMSTFLWGMDREISNGLFEIGGYFRDASNLTTLSFGSVPNKQVTCLKITNTDITEISCNDIFTAFPALQRLHLNGNKKMARITYPTYYHRELREFDVQNNALTHINLNQLLMLSTKLEIINLSGNPITHIKWQPDDFLAHEKVPTLIMKNITSVSFGPDKKLQLLKTSADDNRVYLWMKELVPAFCVLNSIYWFYTKPDNVKLTALFCGVYVPISYCVGRLVVDHILFRGEEEKKIPYFKPIYDV